MPGWHWSLLKRKRSGGKSHPYRKRRAFEMGGAPAETVLGETRIKTQRTRGGGKKVRLLSCKFANVTDPKTGKIVKAEVLKVVENPASADYDRRGIITKGAIIETSAGRARVTSRPGQDGVVNAVLMGEE